MKTTTNALVGWIALAIVLSARIAAAGPIPCTAQAWLGAAVLGQSATADKPTDDKNQQAADLLRRARQAMAENDLSTADSLISRADALGVQYNWLYQGDTPKKARSDLDKKIAASGVKPGQVLSPLGLGKDKTPPTTDPFAGRLANSPGGATPAQQVMPLPAVNSSNPARTLAAQTPPGIPAANDNLLRAAHRALAVGDIRHATELLQQEKARRVTYQPLDDTPEKVEAAMRKYQELSGLDKNSEAYRHAYARNLMDQADGLLRWNEQDEAERLASQAARLQITYGPFEQKPQDLLQRIAAMHGSTRAGR